MMAVGIPDLAAAVPFYGSQPAAEDVPKIQGPLILHYAGLDTHVNEGAPAYEAALKANGKAYTAYVYPNVNHGFHNDTTHVMISLWQNSRGDGRLIFPRKIAVRNRFICRPSADDKISKCRDGESLGHEK